MSIIDSVRRTIRRYGLLPPGSRVAVALSGGADSVALLFVLREIAGAEGFHGRRRGPSESSAARGRCGCRRAVLPRACRAGWSCRSTSSESTSRSLPRGRRLDRAGRPHCAPRVLRRAAVARWARQPSPWRTRKTIRPRRFSCGCCAAPGRVAWAACIRARASSCGRSSRRRGPTSARFCASGRSQFREDASNADLADSAQSHPSRAAAAARRALCPGHRRCARSRGGHRPRRRRVSRWRRARGRGARLISQTARGVELDAEALLRGAAGDCAPRDSPRAADRPPADRFVGFDAVEAVLPLRGV